MCLPNNQPKVIIYRNYKNFDNSQFSEDSLCEIKTLAPLNKNISFFHNQCIVVLDENMALKNKSIS